MPQAAATHWNARPPPTGRPRRATQFRPKTGPGHAAAAERRVGVAHAARIAHGQCLDHHGVGEPYLPLIEALTRLAGTPDGAAVKKILAAQAPSWLAQMPSLWTRSERSALETRGRATRERMLRELTLAVEAMAADFPLLVKIEDIHWSDSSTLDWLAHVARRPELARLMVLATFRPADPAAAKVDLGGLVAELALHGQCKEIALRPLDLDAIESYLQARLRGGAAQAREMAPLLLERTGGNPLFMTSIVNQLAQQHGVTPGAVVSIPHDVRRFIDRQIDDLGESDRSLLAAASVIGREFATAAVAAALESRRRCGRSRLRPAGATTRFHRQGRIGPLARWHARRPLLVPARSLSRANVRPPAGNAARREPRTRRPAARSRLERALDAIAAELAEHFERGNEPVRAIPHHQRAAAKALRRSANAEASEHLRRALDAIGHIADEVERAKIEVELRVALGSAFITTRGFGAPEVLDTYSRAEALCDRLGERADLFPAIWGQWMFRTGRGETTVGRRLGARLLALAKKSGDAGLKIQAHHAMWSTSFVCGDLSQARAHADAALALFDAKIHRSMASSYGNHDAGCCACNFSSLALALAGEAAAARTMMERSLAAARKLDIPLSLPPPQNPGTTPPQYHPPTPQNDTHHPPNQKTYNPCPAPQKKRWAPPTSPPSLLPSLLAISLLPADLPSNTSEQQQHHNPPPPPHHPPPPPPPPPPPTSTLPPPPPPPTPTPSPHPFALFSRPPPFPPPPPPSLLPPPLPPSEAGEHRGACQSCMGQVCATGRLLVLYYQRNGETRARHSSSIAALIHQFTARAAAPYLYQDPAPPLQLLRVSVAK